MKDLIHRFDSAKLAQWPDYEPPSEESITAIQSRFSFSIPSLFIKFARESRSFSSVFLSLGADYPHPSHIITKNEFIRNDPEWRSMGSRVPDNLILITENFMEDFFWCFDLSYPGNDYPVVFWAPERTNSGSIPRYDNFKKFIEHLIGHYDEDCKEDR